VERAGENGGRWINRGGGGGAYGGAEKAWQGGPGEETIHGGKGFDGSYSVVSKPNNIIKGFIYLG